MKKLVVAGLFVVLLVVAPWGIGKVAEQRVDQWLDQLVEAAPYLVVVDRTYTPGWFRSEQDVTFEVLGPFTRALRVTVHNEILHGPVLWFSAVGVARVNSQVVLDPVVRKEVVKLFGAEDPVRVSTRIGFFGGATTTVSGDARSVHSGNDMGNLTWDEFELDISYSKKFDSVDIVGDWPRVEFHDDTTRTQFLMSDLTIDGKARRVKGDLYNTDLDFAIDELRVSGADDAVAEIRDIHYVIDTQDDGDFMSIATRVGSGKVRGAVLEQKGLTLNAVHYDFTLRRLHTATLARFMGALKDSYTQPKTNLAANSAVLLDPIAEQAFELLKHDPEFVIDRIGIETPDGAGYLKGVIRLKGVTEKDLKTGALPLIAKLDVDLRFEAPQKMLEKIEGGTSAVTLAVDGGYAERVGDKLVSHIEFHEGELKINGKVQGIPGLGAPPARPE